MAEIARSQRAEFFDSVRSVAVVGVSSNKMKFGSAACRELKQRGFTVYPVHPTLDAFEGDPCFHTLAELPVAPDCVVVSVKPSAAEDVVRQVAERGTRKVWFQQGKDFSIAAARAQQLGLQTVQGRCVLMYAGQATGIHRFHRALSRLFGKY